MLRFTLYTFHKSLNLFEDAQRRESFEYFPLELRLHPIDAIHILEVTVLRIPFNFTHPSCVWVTSHLAHTKYWVGEDIDFGSRDLMSSFVQQAYRSLRSSSSSIIFRPTISGIFKTKDLWLVFLFHKKFVPESPRDGSSRNVNSCHCLFRDELLLEDWYSSTFPNSQIHIQIFLKFAWLFSIDLPDRGEDGFRDVAGDMWR